MRRELEVATFLKDFKEKIYEKSNHWYGNEIDQRAPFYEFQEGNV